MLDTYIFLKSFDCPFRDLLVAMLDTHEFSDSVLELINIFLYRRKEKEQKKEQQKGTTSKWKDLGLPAYPINGRNLSKLHLNLLQNVTNKSIFKGNLDLFFCWFYKNNHLRNSHAYFFALLQQNFTSPDTYLT